jgi:hypothetical protein
MRMEVGPRQRDYSPAPVYREASERYRGRASLVADGALHGYVAGQPFPLDELDCQGDPEAGAKLAWDFVHRWQGFGASAHFRVTSLARGRKRDPEVRGRGQAWFLKHRPEPRFRDTGGDVFPRESSFLVARLELERPARAEGTRTLSFRYEDSFGPLALAVPEETWIYVPREHRSRKRSEIRRSEPVAGTDFVFDDLMSFSGLPPQYAWRCLGERELLAPVNTRLLGYPYAEDTRFGPSGLSFAGDRWELRRAIGLELRPRDPAHPVLRKELWLDRQTLQPLYAFVYDRAGGLWKIITHDHRWSEDDLAGLAARTWYPAWEEVPEPRDLRVVADSILDLRAGTGTLVEYWDSQGSPLPLPELRTATGLGWLRRGKSPPSSDPQADREVGAQ